MAPTQNPHNPLIANGLGIQTITPPNHNIMTHFSDSGSDIDDEEGSPIYLKISTPLVVKGDNNLIAVDPSAQASKLAMAIVQSLKQLSHGADGIPMIDENGRPRPLKVDVKAEITVEGSKNVVGEQAVLGSVMGAGLKRKVDDAKALPMKDLKDLKEVRKREREDGDLVEGDAKRAKTE
jgi:hypothetical protein